MPNDSYRAIHELCNRGLVVVASDDETDLTVARPRSAGGTPFPLSDCGGVVSGIDNTYLITDVPVATIRLADGLWCVDISEVAAPGPGPVFFRADFPNAQDAAAAVIDCFFGDRVDFARPELAPWIDRD